VNHDSVRTWIDRDKPKIKKSMQIRPQQEPIRHMIRSIAAIGKDMGCLQHIQNAAAGDGTSRRVRFDQSLPKSPLAAAKYDGD
jgi:hypothetical protein